jgi:hypothetical protein
MKHETRLTVTCFDNLPGLAVSKQPADVAHLENIIKAPNIRLISLILSGVEQGAEENIWTEEG